MSLVQKEPGTFRSFDGTKIYYEVRGEGEPLILNYGISNRLRLVKMSVIYFFLHFRQQFFVDLGEIIYKVQGVLYFVCNTCCQFSQ